MSFTRKRIDVTITLGTGTFGETGSDTVTLTGLRVHAMIQATYGEAMPAVHARIFGLPIEMMNQLTTIGLVNSAVRLKNKILIAAGDDETGMSTAYSGTISVSWINMDGAPDSCLEVIGVAGLAASIKPVEALSIQGAADVATIMGALAEQMGFAFENNGVQVQLSNPYFPGTALMQAKACARAADICMTIDRDTLAIWPKDDARDTPEGIPLISKATGMRGYPRFASNGIEVSMLWSPQIKPGGKVQVQSALTMACGTWLVSNAMHTLESETPNGQWFTRILGVPLPNG